MTKIRSSRSGPVGRAAQLWSLAACLWVAAGCGDGEPNRELASGAAIAVAPMPAFHAPIRARVQDGDTIESVSRRLAGDDWMRWRDALLEQIDARRLLPGTVFEGECSPGGDLERLTVVLDRRTRLVLAEAESSITVERRQRPITSELQRLEGEVVSSLFGSIEAAGGHPELAVRLAEVFQWDIDFFRDLRSGDRFVAVVDRQSVDGEFFGYGTLYAARFMNDGRTLDAVAYPDANGRVGYYDLDGRPLRKQFLRSPLKFSRITSRFSMNRFHPVLKRRMPHYGVDYGAPVGTPVHATADGRVSFVGRNGGAGRMVRLRHTNGYETNYLHLSRYGPGITTGARVHQGDVVGYVGSSGLSTGPHLDYRVKLNGRWINPLTISSPAAEPLEPHRMQRFLSHAVGILSLLHGDPPPAGAQC